MSISNIINGSSQASIRILLGLFPIVSYGLIVGNIFAQFIAVIYLIYPLHTYIKMYSKEKFRMISIKDLSIKYKKFPIYDAPAKFIEFSVINLVIIILSNYFEREEIGYFSMVIQFILLPISVVGSAMGNVYYKELSENYYNPSAISSITRKVAKISFILSLFPILF
jgi:O-antigen/teichoic acid export membrane protein